MNSQIKQTQGDVWKGPECRSLCFRKLGCTTLPKHRPVPCSETLQIPSFEVFLEASSRKHDRSLTYFLASLPSLEDGDGGRGKGAEHSKLLLIMVWSF